MVRVTVERLGPAGKGRKPYRDCATLEEALALAALRNAEADHEALLAAEGGEDKRYRYAVEGHE